MADRMAFSAGVRAKTDSETGNGLSGPGSALKP
jgi:hypothetical protein